MNDAHLDKGNLDISDESGSGLQARELQLLSKITQVLESHNSMPADQIARSIQEKHILVLSLLDKVSSIGMIHRWENGNFSLHDETNAPALEEPDKKTHEGSDTLSPARRASMLIELWNILSSNNHLDITVKQGIEATHAGQLVVRVMVEAGGMPVIEVWKPSREDGALGEPQLVQVTRVTGELQFNSALRALSQTLSSLGL